MHTGGDVTAGRHALLAGGHGELADLDCAKIRQHLDECGPCLREYGLEEAVKRVVQKHCGCDPAPAELRAKILVRIREVRASIEFAE